MTSRFQPPPIIKAAERLLLEIEQAVRQFPRYHRYAVGADLRKQAMTVFSHANRAWRDRARQGELVGQLVWDIDSLKQHLQLAKLLHAFNSLATRQDSLGDGVYVDRWVQGAWVGFRAALRAAPEGFVLVPVEPTEEMIEASLIRVPIAKRINPGQHLRIYGARAWDAMLAARPQGVKDV